MKRTLIASASALALVAAGATSANAWPSWPAWLHRTDPTTSTHTTTTTAAARSDTAEAPAPVALAPRSEVRIEPLPAGSVPNYRAIVQAQGPAVVGVTVAGLHNAAASDDEGPSSDDDPFFRFFRGVPGLRMPPQGPSPFRGQGSGFIVSADGVILTNAHVVREAKQVNVKLADRREFAAKVLGIDTATDIAVLKIDAKGLPTVNLGDAKALQVGDWVLAIGTPFGFEQTATQGIVSAKGRSLPGDSYVPFIQTDAAVNPGNSGGPLFDGAGRVIGINAQIYSRSGGFQGLSFAIPIDVALHAKDQIVAHGRVDHARLGVTLQDLSAPLAESFGMASPDGALVASVAPDSAAARAGLKPGDVVTAFDGDAVHTAGDVSNRVGVARPGERHTLAVWRDKSRREVTVALGKADLEKTEAVAQADNAALGLSLRPLERADLQRAGVDHGLLIERVAGPAQLAGVEPGDVLLAVNGRPVQGIGQVREVLRTHPKHVALLVAREGQQIFVPVDLG